MSRRTRKPELKLVEDTGSQLEVDTFEPLPQQEEMPFAMVEGEPFTELPKDLYIPPDALQVILEAFEGPLDLLLYLIRRQNLDVLDIPIAEITRQYMKYIEVMQELQLELAGEYLLMAAMLAEIKSRMLLPTLKKEGEDEEDPRAELVRRLQEYERFKKAAEDIDRLPRMERDTMPTSVELVERKVVRIQPEVSLQEMLLAFKEVLSKADMFTSHRIRREQLSVRQRMSEILSRLRESAFIEFVRLFDAAEGRMGVAVTFIATLELMKEGLIEIVQAQPYAPIHVRPAGGTRHLSVVQDTSASTEDADAENAAALAQPELPGENDDPEQDETTAAAVPEGEVQQGTPEALAQEAVSAIVPEPGTEAVALLAVTVQAVTTQEGVDPAAQPGSAASALEAAATTEVVAPVAASAAEAGLEQAASARSEGVEPAIAVEDVAATVEPIAEAAALEQQGVLATPVEAESAPAALLVDEHHADVEQAAAPAAASDAIELESQGALPVALLESEPELAAQPLAADASVSAPALEALAAPAPSVEIVAAVAASERARQVAALLHSLDLDPYWPAVAVLEVASKFPAAEPDASAEQAASFEPPLAESGWLELEPEDADLIVAVLEAELLIPAVAVEQGAASAEHVVASDADESDLQEPVAAVLNAEPVLADPLADQSGSDTQIAAAIASEAQPALAASSQDAELVAASLEVSGGDQAVAMAAPADEVASVAGEFATAESADAAAASLEVAAEELAVAAEASLEPVLVASNSIAPEAQQEPEPQQQAGEPVVAVLQVDDRLASPEEQPALVAFLDASAEPDERLADMAVASPDATAVHATFEVDDTGAVEEELAAVDDATSIAASFEPALAAESDAALGETATLAPVPIAANDAIILPIALAESASATDELAPDREPDVAPDFYADQADLAAPQSDVTLGWPMPGAAESPSQIFAASDAGATMMMAPGELADLEPGRSVAQVGAISTTDWFDAAVKFVMPAEVVEEPAVADPDSDAATIDPSMLASFDTGADPLPGTATDAASSLAVADAEPVQYTAPAASLDAGAELLIALGEIADQQRAQDLTHIDSAASAEPELSLAASLDPDALAEQAASSTPGLMAAELLALDLPEPSPPAASEPVQDQQPAPRIDDVDAAQVTMLASDAQEQRFAAFEVTPTFEASPHGRTAEVDFEPAIDVPAAPDFDSSAPLHASAEPHAQPTADSDQPAQHPVELQSAHIASAAAHAAPALAATEWETTPVEPEPQPQPIPAAAALLESAAESAVMPELRADPLVDPLRDQLAEASAATALATVVLPPSDPVPAMPPPSPIPLEQPRLAAMTELADQEAALARLAQRIEDTVESLYEIDVAAFIQPHASFEHDPAGTSWIAPDQADIPEQGQ